MNCIELRTEVFWMLDIFGGLTICQFISIYIYKSSHWFDPKLALLKVIYFDVLVAQGLSAALWSWAVPASRPQWMAMLREPPFWDCFSRKEPLLFRHVWSMYRSSPFRSTLNTNVITGLDMGEICTEAVRSVALWTPTLSRVWTWVQYATKQSIPWHFEHERYHGFGHG